MLPPRIALLTLTSTLVLACGGPPAPSPETCAGPSAVSPSAPVTQFEVRFTAGSSPLELGAEVPFAGLHVSLSKARLYLSELALRGEDGALVPAELVDANGDRVPYDLMLADLERPESLGFAVRAPAGRYRGLSISVGVPSQCASGAELNGVDASAMAAPLDVDSDMYWSWSAGYVFLKLEGQVRAGSSPGGFFYHVGGGDRFAALELPGHFEIGPTGGRGPSLIADFQQLLTSPSGALEPDLADADERRVHGGRLADALARNVRGSGFLTLEHHHR